MLRFLVYLEAALKNNKYKLKGKILKWYFIIHGCKVGKKLRCHKFPQFRTIPQKNITIGNNVTIGYKITLEPWKGGVIILGDHVNLTQNILISSGLRVEIGKNTLIGENVSIRDGNHGILKEQKIVEQSHTYEQVSIGADVWIGAGCYILYGSVIPDGVVIGANSVVLKKTKMKPWHIYAGSPVKEIGTRI